VFAAANRSRPCNGLWPKSAIGTGEVFSKGRDFGAWLGVVPKQISTGDRTILGSISKRGNRYLRVLFVQAAWVVLVKLGPEKWERYGLKSWIEAAKKRLHHNVLAIALANKLARIAWAVLNKGAPSRAPRPMRWRPVQRDPRAVLGARQGVAWQHGHGKQGLRRPALTAPTRGAAARAVAGTKERPPGTNKGTAMK
jgi:hypothetical protein